jgi:sterol desaturase/sphingolipid hydroxylase (fatty acid hydroxylase superfamily)
METRAKAEKTIASTPPTAKRLRQAVRFLYVPVMLLGFNGLAYAIVANGYSYLWVAPVLVAALLLAHAAERIAPYFEEWNEPHGDGETNLLHFLIYESTNLAGILTIPLVVWLFQLKPGDLTGIWPRDWPLWAQLIIAILAIDFIGTAIHLLSHRWPRLWRLHAVHHGAGRLYGMNGPVRHPLHQLLDMAIGTAPLALLGMPVPCAVLLGFAVTIQLVVQHSNVDHEIGPFRNWIAIGRIHHLHHVNWGKEGDCNFGLFVTLWDRMFGTFHPEPPRPIGAGDLGIDDVPEFPRTYREHLAFPFRYRPGAAGEARRMIDEAAE